MIIIEDNILNSKEPILAHQVNCKGVMGAGLAKTLKDRYFSNFTEYKNFCLNTDYPLGECLVTKQSDRYIANLFGQNGFGRNGRQTDYNALENALSALKKFAEQLNDCRANNLRDDNTCNGIAIPYNLGCDLAGGDWNVVSSIIDKIFDPQHTSIIVTAYKLN